MSDTSYDMVNDYTLQERQDLRWNVRLTHVFNFNAREVTTIFENTDASPSMSHFNVRKFSEYDGDDHIRFAHAELVRQGGSPPALDQILDDLGSKKKPAKPMKITG